MYKVLKVLNVIKSRSWVALRKSFYKLFGLSLLLTLIEFFTLGLFALIFTGTEDGLIFNLIQNAGEYLSIDITMRNLIVCLVFAAAVRLVLILFFAKTQVKEINQLMTDIRNKLFYKFMFLKPDEKPMKTSDLSNMIIRESEKVAECLNYLVEIFKKSLIFVLYISMSLMIDYTALLFFAFLAPVLILLSSYVNKFLPGLSSRLLQQTEKINSVTINFANNRSVVRLLRDTNFITQKYNETLKLFESTKNKLDIFGRIGKALPEAAGVLLVSVILLGTEIIQSGRIAETLFTAGLIYRAFGMGISIQYLLMKLLSLSAQTLKVFEGIAFFEKLPAVKYIKSNSTNHLKMNLNNFSIGETFIEKFEHSFHSGTIYLVKGPSGVGKSTLLKLITGEVLSDGFKLSIPDGTNFFDKYNRPTRKVNLVTQDFSCLDDSFSNNISLFETEPDFNKIDDLIHLVDLKEIFNNDKQSAFDLSGGQKQRLSLARALYSGPDILVLDEFTSALDSDLEQGIMKKIQELKAERITFIVSHSKNIEEFVDVILTMSPTGISVLNKKENFQLG